MKLAITEQAAEQKPDNDSADVRNALIKRLGVAGVLVALLLGVLALFDRLASPPEEPELPVFTKPVPVGPRKEVSQPVTQLDHLPEPPVAPATEIPPPPVVEAQPPAVAEVLPEATEKSRSAASTATPTRHAKLPAPAPAARSVPEETGTPERVIVAEAPASPPPPAQASVTRQASRPSATVTPSPPRLFSGFLLQAGVFSSAQRAEELHAKLTLSGVPSTLETRVQVGPFRTKQEAEAAQSKLKELGIESVLLPPRGGKP